MLHCFQQSIALGLYPLLRRYSANQVGTRRKGSGHSFRHRLTEVVALGDVGDRPAIRNNVSFKSPILAEMFLQQSRVGTRGLAVD